MTILLALLLHIILLPYGLLRSKSKHIRNFVSTSGIDNHQSSQRYLILFRCLHTLRLALFVPLLDNMNDVEAVYQESC